MKKESDFFTVTYHIRNSNNIEKIAQEIAEEQTVEIPHENIPESLFKNGIVGEILSIEKENDFFKIKIKYRNDITAFSIPQFLNVLFGNISLKKGIKIVDLTFSKTLISKFKGPSWGIDGIRKLIGIYNRPLIATAPKPLGLSCSKLAEIAGECAYAGIDIIKDDHGITDQDFHPFEERINRVCDAIEEANIKNGNLTLYFPNICGSIEKLEKKIEIILKRKIRGILISPQLMGFDFIRYLSSRYGMIIMAHPAFTGSLFTSNDNGISAALFLGTLFRIMGADISIYPSWGGRFPFTKEMCLEIAKALTTDTLPVKKAFPAPAGGISFEKLNEIASAYGEDTILLIGGALLFRYSSLYKSAIVFMEEIKKLFNEKKEAPYYGMVSSCEYNSRNTIKNYQPYDVMKFNNYRWEGRDVEDYKIEGSADFAGISRTELIGKIGTNTKFDLRYFEIASGGYSTLERHQHEHVIIGVRGEGILIKNEKRISISPNDIAYVAPFELHQLRNEKNTPFGFYCIVDHERDAPIPMA
ncbi:MAG: RuBisCO large subunit C-terminal-like domain-containing protein [Chitinispirillaceae bacterium]|nr:RuBisCO large subunit C-terminal-like domain-containing protein [Chitinispirillaceae bacterium]